MDYKTKLSELKFKAFYYKEVMDHHGIKETDKPAAFLSKLSQLKTLDSLKNEALKLIREVTKPQTIGANNSQEQTINKINNLFTNK
jgi:hypothetical protein